MSVPRLTEILESILRNGRLKIRQRDDYNYAWEEYNVSQTAQQIVAAPGAGYKIVVKYCSIRVNTNSGKAYFHTSDNSIKFGMVYPTMQQNVVNTDISIELPENTALLLTSTTGAHDLFCSANYVVESVG